MYHREAMEQQSGPGGGGDRAVDDILPPSPAPSTAASPYWGESTAAKKPEGFSPLVAFCFTINYILGTGFLTVPWAFTQGGLVLSTVVIITVGLFSDMAKNYLLETMARAEAMLDNRMHWIKKNPGDEEKGLIVYSPVVMKEETHELLSRAVTGVSEYDAVASNHGMPTGKASYGSTHSLHSLGKAAKAIVNSLPGTPGPSEPSSPKTKLHGRQLIHRPTPKYMVKHRKFEVNTLCRVFLTKTGLRVYTAFICLYIYCSLWAYTSVFASAMAKAAPIFAGGDMDTNYLIYALVFAAMVIPMSCMELDEQVVVQVTMTGARFLMLFLMVGTTTLCAQDNIATGHLTEAPMFRPSGIHKMLPIMVFAHIYHHSVPGLAHPVADKKKLGGIFQSTTIFSTIAYTFIGLVLGSAFGAGIEESSNLNWKGFTGGTAVMNNDGQIVSVAWWAKAISLYIICFPAIDVISAFPLNAITLGNNMLGAFYGSKIHQVEHNRWIRSRFRLVASVPPIILGILERKLGTITDYAGTTGFIIGFSFPALLYLRSRYLAEKKHFSVNTYYSTYSSSYFAAGLLLVFGLSMMSYVVYCLIAITENE